MTPTTKPTTKKKSSKPKTAPKVGRNPFSQETVNEAPAAQETPTVEATASATTEDEAPRKPKRGILERLDGALSWKLRQFSILRYEGEKSAGRLSLFSVGLENPRWKASRTLNLGQIKRKSFAASVVSIRIHTA